MRAIERETISAVRDANDTAARYVWRRANMHVQKEADTAAPIRVYLHGNEIARFYNDATEWSLAGWNTPTTRSRINALAHEFGLPRVTTRRGQPFAVCKTGAVEITNTEWVRQ